MQQADFTADVLFLLYGQLFTTVARFDLICLADNKQHPVPVCAANHLMIKMLIHGHGVILKDQRHSKMLWFLAVIIF